MTVLTNLVKLRDYLLKNKTLSGFLITNFQLSKFYRPESTDIKGFSKSGTIEWE
tara:strand:+ start:702 stop:863 length:162 start_codon:yes stop_codon:yes gene_type:complete